MSFVTDQVRRLDAKLDRIQILSGALQLQAPHHDADSAAAAEAEMVDGAESISGHELDAFREMRAKIKTFSTTQQPLLKPKKLLALLQECLDKQLFAPQSLGLDQAGIQDDLQWLLVGKAAAQIYGLVLNTYLDQIIPLSNDIWYWDEVLNSNSRGGVYYYSLQTSPLRLWTWGVDIYQDVRRKAEQINSQRIAQSEDGDTQFQQLRNSSFTAPWIRFWRLVRRSVQEHSLTNLQSRFMSPVTQCRVEARKKQRQLQRLREMSACSLGILSDEALNFDVDDVGSVISRSGEEQSKLDDWKSIIMKSVVLMDSVLHHGLALDQSVGDFEDLVFSVVHDEVANTEDAQASIPAVLTESLISIVKTNLPQHVSAINAITKENGKPPRWVRYWLPASALILGSALSLSMFYSRKAEIIVWIRNFGETAGDFLTNWVYEPIRKTIGTIRHDKDSEIAIMSKQSLEGDRASLERMVIDFSRDHPLPANESHMQQQGSDAQLADLRAKIREGDITPVLKVYERDLQRPFMGAIRGDLVRALLIQVQKTKVDVEVALGGIDSLLKSQELVFAFVGLTPGILVCLGVTRWLANTFGGRTGRSKEKRRIRMVRVLREVDRIFCASSPADKVLPFKEHGLVLCTVHLLQRDSRYVLPSEVNKEFLEDLNDLVDLNTGIERQKKAVDRIRWAYAKWLL